MIRRLRHAVAFAAFAVAFTALASPAHAAASAAKSAPLKPWTVDDILALRTVREPQLSPDGTRVAYVVTSFCSDSTRYQSDLWLGTLATGEQRRLTSTDAEESAPRWSADGRTLAFLSDREAPGSSAKGMQVWTLPLDGGEAAPFTRAPSGVTRFEWFANGSGIAYLAPEGPTAAGLARAARKDDSRVMSERPGYARVWALDRAGGKATAITPAETFVSSFTLAPDGRRVVYCVQPEPGFNGRYDSDLFSIPVTGGKPVALVQRPGMDLTPKYSRDGRWIAFLSHDGQPGGSANKVSLCVVNAAGGGAVNITPKFDERIGGPGVMTEPVWMPDNESVLFGSPDRTNIRIFRAFTDDRPVEPVTRDAGCSDWPSMDAAGKVLAWTHEDGTHPGDVWVWEFERSAPRTFTDLNPWTRERHEFAPQVVTWPGAGGQQVEGLLYAPLQSRPGVRAPLLLDVHGGPAANHAQYFSAIQEGFGLPLLLQKGWAVLMPNPRGSAGYGSEWRLANTRDWWDKPYVDLMSGVDAMIRLGFADSTKLAVCGWSYGGYMTTNIVTRTTRFRAAVAGAGPVNLAAQAGTSDIPGLMRSSMAAWPWEDPQVYVENSPIFRAGAVRTPTAFIHGEQDVRVNPAESLNMYRALRTRGIPTDLMMLPRAGHGPDEPAHLRATMEWTIEWLTRWTLGNAPAAPARRAVSGGFR
ncbi:MAG: S9 family peptidase [Candidatus Eisenbacteria bacterium]|uniref:S9 family peptidase n=1 Tax=Eiseniibacteriota bacterium TaxID=2212470 RepID=A0A933SCM0_UNCEI|nr:S9 family peptidase [Candidatus Eisenbacteria bacterium]